MDNTRLAVVLGDQLFPDHSALVLEGQTSFFMAEDYNLCTHFRYHKHKITLFLSAMRSHAADLQKAHRVYYYELSKATKEETYFDKVAAVLQREPSLQEIITYEISDRFFREQMVAFCEEHHLDLTEVPSPGFLTSKADFRDYLDTSKRPFMKTFYERQRKRLGLLVDSAGHPLHGKWSFDADNRKKLPKNTSIPDLPRMSETQETADVKALVDELFADHPGQTRDFWLGTTRRQALVQLDRFLKERFNDFGPYEDAFESDQAFIFHSTLSPYINLGLLTPDEVVDKAINYAQDNEVAYSSLEGFVRQVIGWREFVKGIYDHYEDQFQSNHFNHKRQLTDHWYEGTTGVAPLDDTILKAKTYGYTHHIERLMIVGNVMLLCEVHPDEAYRWFMEMYVDSADWVMVPNVYGMTQFAGGGVFATKPYICGANYWCKMSHYSKKSPWTTTVNGLYWRFIDHHRDFFIKNHRMSMMVKMYDKKTAQQKEELTAAATRFMDKVTRT